MNTKLIDAIAKALLYEGYMLYPYRASSVKNRQRFNFGVLYPQSYSEAQVGADAWNTQTEFLVEGVYLTAIEIRVRFLRLVARSVNKPAGRLPGQSLSSARFESVSKLEVDGNVFQPWQEAVECDVVVPSCNLVALTENPLKWTFSLPAKEETQPVHDTNGELVGQIARKQEAVRGIVEVAAERLGDGLFKVQTRVKNLTELGPSAGPLSRDHALMRSLVSAHILLGAVDGQFVSLLEPPENLKEFAGRCQNVGVWPVLVGAEGERDTMLASPVILYDYPQIAPESPGDLFDGTEIDEILALRIMTMTDDEKREMRNTDERARNILERTESLPMEHLVKLHGTLRELRSLKEETP